MTASTPRCGVVGEVIPQPGLRLLSLQR